MLPVRLEQSPCFTEGVSLQEAFDKKIPQRFPWVKKNGQALDFLGYPQGFKLDGARVFLPKRGWVRFINSREIGATGKKVPAKSRLNSSLLGQGWLEFRRQLEDKLAGNGGWRHTYQKGRTCPVCRCSGRRRHAASSRNPPRQLLRSVCSCAGGGGILGPQAGENVKTVSQCPIVWLQKHSTCGFWHSNWRLDFSPFSHLRPISNCRNLQHNISNYQVPWQRLFGMAWHEVMAIFC